MEDTLAIVMPFIMIIAVVWLVLHYRRHHYRGKTVHSPEEQQTMERMVILLEKMEGRIATLEKILDAEDPRWREKGAPSDRI